MPEISNENLALLCTPPDIHDYGSANRDTPRHDFAA